MDRDMVDPKQSALLVIDVQNDFIHSEGAMAKAGSTVIQAQAMVPQLIKFIEEARKIDLPVIYTRATHSRWTDTPSWRQRVSPAVDLDRFCRPNTWGCDFYQVKPEEDELVILKPRYSSFIGTHLELTLRAIGARGLILTGVATGGCVEATARHGQMLDYDILVVEDCTAGGKDEHHRAALNRMKGRRPFVVTSSQEVVEVWQELASMSKV